MGERPVNALLDRNCCASYLMGADPVRLIATDQVSATSLAAHKREQLHLSFGTFGSPLRASTRGHSTNYDHESTNVGI